MTVAAEVSEAVNGTALLAEARRCLRHGCDLKGKYIRQVISLIENAAIADLSGWTQAVDNHEDGRNAAEATAIA
jgi:hypothetical protein